MNILLLKYYLKTGNSLKIKSLSDGEYEKTYRNASFVDKVRLAHLRGKIISNLERFELYINGRGLYELLDDKNSMMFYFELLDYINKDILFDGKYIKRFNIPFWKNKLEESGYFSFGSYNIYNLIDENPDFLIDLLENNKDFRKIFFRNVSFDGNLYEPAINRILSNRKIGIYLSKQPEMFKFYNKNCSSMLCDLDESFFENLPDEYKFLIGYHVRPNFSNERAAKKYTDKIKNVLVSYFPFLLENEISNILSLYNSDVSSDNIASMISFLINDHDFYPKYKFLCDNYFDGDINKTIYFYKKYDGTKLLKEISFNYVPDIKEKILFLSFANRLKGINSLDDVMNKSIEELKNTENDYSSYRSVKDDVRVFGKNDFISLNYDREIIIIYPDGTLDEREATESHDQVLHDLILENNYEYYGPILFKNMVLTLTGEGNVILLAEGDNVICAIPNNINSLQKQNLKELFNNMNEKSQVSLCMEEKGEILALNNGDSMSSDDATSELSRVRTM